jgi:hypothetical protein
MLNGFWEQDNQGTQKIGNAIACGKRSAAFVRGGAVASWAVIVVRGTEEQNNAQRRQVGMVAEPGPRLVAA